MEGILNVYSWNFAYGIWFDPIDLSKTWTLDLYGFVRFSGLAFVLVANLANGSRGYPRISTNAVGNAEVGSSLRSA